MVGAGRYQYTYRDLAIEGAPPPMPPGSPRVDVTRNFSASIGYNIGPDMRLGFGASYWQRESSLTAYRDYDALRIGISLNYGL
jgi:hypothetical protein